MYPHLEMIYFCLLQALLPPDISLGLSLPGLTPAEHRSHTEQPLALPRGNAVQVSLVSQGSTSGMLWVKGANETKTKSMSSPLVPSCWKSAAKVNRQRILPKLHFFSIRISGSRAGIFKLTSPWQRNNYRLFMLCVS